MHFGERDCAHIRADDRFDVLHAKRQGAVHAHDDVELAFLMQAARGFAHHQARGRLFVQRDAVFQVKVNRVAVERECLFDVLGYVGRHEMQGSPGRQRAGREQGLILMIQSWLQSRGSYVCRFVVSCVVAGDRLCNAISVAPHHSVRGCTTPASCKRAISAGARPRIDARTSSVS